MTWIVKIEIEFPVHPTDTTILYDGDADADFAGRATEKDRWRTTYEVAALTGLTQQRVTELELAAIRALRWPDGEHRRAARKSTRRRS